MCLAREKEGRWTVLPKIFDRSSKNFRYYVSPICEIVANLTSCVENEYDSQHPYKIMLPIRLWNQQVAKTAALAINQKIQKDDSNATEAKPDDCRPLPLKSVS